MKLDWRLIRQVFSNPVAWVLTLLFSFTGGVLIIIQARLLTNLIESVFIKDMSRGEISGLFKGLFLVILLRAGTMLGSEVSACRLAINIKQHLRNMYFQHIMRLGPSFVNNQQSADLVNNAAQGIEALDAYFSQYLPQIVLAALIPISILVVVLPVDPLSGFIMALTAPLIPIFMILIGKGSEIVTRHQWSALTRLSTYFLDTLQGLRELKQLGQSAARVRTISTKAETYRKTTMQVLRVTFLSAFVLEFLATLSTAVIAVQIGLRALYGNLTFHDAFFILLLAPEFYMPLRLLGQRFHAGMTGIIAARDIYKILEIPVPEEAADPIQVMPSETQTIRFEQVSYSYPGRDALALANISFQIHPGERVALVGASGAGKSTIAQLLMGFMQPDQGKIYYGSSDLAEIEPVAWRKLITWVPQQPFLFNTSFRNNITLSDQTVSDQELMSAILAARLEDVLENLPQGLDTPLGECGSRLSGGQAQRVALARAFLKQSSIVVLDEPTAHLDVQLEDRLDDAIQQIYAQKTVLVIAHRLQTVIHADRILVLEDSKIVESGTPEELLSAKGSYAHLASTYYGGVI